MAAKRFEARLWRSIDGADWTFLTVPFSVEEAFGARARLAVRGTLGGAPFRSSLMPQGDGTHVLPVNRRMREAAGGVAAGDVVEVELEPDDAPRTVEAPADLARALAEAPAAEAAWARLAPSHRKAYVDWIEEAKKPETRARRVGKAVGMVGEGKKLK